MKTISFVIQKNSISNNNVVRVDDYYLVYNKYNQTWDVLLKDTFLDSYETDNLLEVPFAFDDTEFVRLITTIKTLLTSPELYKFSKIESYKKPSLFRRLFKLK